MVHGNLFYKIIVLVMLILLITASAVICWQYQTIHSQPPTAVIENNDKEELTDTSTGMIRIKINPFITIKNGTMQNLNFCNYNEDRLLVCKIKVNDTYIYESDYVDEGNILKGDYIETGCLEKGGNEALAEIYSFSKEKEPMGQTNVKIVLSLT